MSAAYEYSAHGQHAVAAAHTAADSKQSHIVYSLSNSYGVLAMCSNMLTSWDGSIFTPIDFLFSLFPILVFGFSGIRLEIPEDMELIFTQLKNISLGAHKSP